jgi:hypothetical protein
VAEAVVVKVPSRQQDPVATVQQWVAIPVGVLRRIPVRESVVAQEEPVLEIRVGLAPMVQRAS